MLKSLESFPLLEQAGEQGGKASGGQQAGGSGNGEWQDSLPETVRGWDEVKNSDSPEKFWDQMTNMRSLVGQSIRIPTEEAGEEQWTQFHEKLKTKVPGLMPTPNSDDDASMQTLYRQLGQPEKAEEYKIPQLDGQGTQLDVGPVEAFRGIAHKYGLNQKQFEGIVTEFTGLNVEGAIQAKQAHDAKITELKNEWGAAYDQNINLIKALATKTDAPQALMDAINNSTADAASLRWMYQVAKQFGGAEGVNLISDQSQGTQVMTPAEAQQLISRTSKVSSSWSQR